MKPRAKLLLSTLLAAALACQSEPAAPPPAPAPGPAAAPAAPVAPTAAAPTERGPVTAWEDTQPFVPDSASQVPSEAMVGDQAFQDFAGHAFPPTLSPADFHREAWIRDDCMTCHGTGSEGAPVVRHAGMSPRLVIAKCRTCHVLEPEGEFAYDAFPPTLPDDSFHADAWQRTDCLLCHETGVRDAPLVRHRGMSRLLLKGNCRSCHVVSRPGPP